MPFFLCYLHADTHTHINVNISLLCFLLFVTCFVCILSIEAWNFYFEYVLRIIMWQHAKIQYILLKSICTKCLFQIHQKFESIFFLIPYGAVVIVHIKSVLFCLFLHVHISFSFASCWTLCNDLLSFNYFSFRVLTKKKCPLSIGWLIFMCRIFKKNVLALYELENAFKSNNIRIWLVQLLVEI